MVENFENLDNIFTRLGKRYERKKYCRGIEQVREAYPSRKQKDKAVFFLENGTEKILPQSAVERD